MFVDLPGCCAAGGPLLHNAKRVRFRTSRALAVQGRGESARRDRRSGTMRPYRARPWQSRGVWNVERCFRHGWRKRTWVKRCPLLRMRVAGAAYLFLNCQCLFSETRGESEMPLCDPGVFCASSDFSGRMLDSGDLWEPPLTRNTQHLTLGASTVAQRSSGVARSSARICAQSLQERLSQPGSAEPSIRRRGRRGAEYGSVPLSGSNSAPGMQNPWLGAAWPVHAPIQRSRASHLHRGRET